MTPLARLLESAKADRSVDSLIAEAERKGASINSTARATIYKALKGDHAKEPRDETLQMFAAVFGLDVREVRKAAGMARGELGPWTPTTEANRLDQDQRNALDALIKTIVKTGGEHGGDTAATSGPDPSPVSDLPVVRDVDEEFEVDWAAREDPKGRNRT